MADIAVSGGAAWVCRGQRRQLADILLPVYITDDKQEVVETERDEPDSSALLEQLEAGAPCVLTLRCGSAPSAPPATIRSVLVVSEARTMEVYGPTGDYCGTGRGERDGLEPDSADRGPFYRKQLILEQPSTSCEVKLLSLGGRNSVLVRRVVLGLQPARPGPGRGPGIDMQQVQSLVEEMGTGLSPGAQSLMDMVQLQQQNQAGSLAGFLPLLMGGGVLPARSRGAEPAGLGLRPPAAAGPVDGAQNGAPCSDESDSASPPPRPNPLRFDTNSTTSGEGSGPESSAQLVQMMSRFLNGHAHGQASSSAPELLPMLQRVCGQVTQLRLDAAAEKGSVNGGWALDPAMERRLEQMERSLKEHIDRRLDALERRLEAALLLLPGGAAPAGAAEKIRSDQTPACTESAKPDA